MEHSRKVIEQTAEDNLYSINALIKKSLNNLTIKGDLDLGNTAMKWSPDSLTAGGRVDLTNTALEDLKENTMKDEKIALERHEAIEILKALCRVEGCLMSNSDLQGAGEQLHLVVKLITEKLNGDME